MIRAVSLREQYSYLHTIVDMYKLEVMVIALSDRLNLEKKFPSSKVKLLPLVLFLLLPTPLKVNVDEDDFLV